jgi:DNA-damage-inducible protein J
MGLSVSDAVRVFLKRVVVEQAMPFDVRVPNIETRAAMAEADGMVRARHARFTNSQEMFDALEKEASKQ